MGPPPASLGTLRVASSLHFPPAPVLCCVDTLSWKGLGVRFPSFCLAVPTVAALTLQAQEPT